MTTQPGLLRRAVVVAAAIVLGSAAGGAWALYGAASNPGNAFSAAPDLTPPTVTRATVAKSGATTGAGTIRSGGAYYVYAEPVDQGNPPSGVATVTADTSSFDTGVTAAALTSTGGPWTIDGQTYSHRSAALTANTALTTSDAYPYSVTATDALNLSATASYAAAIETYQSAILGTAGLVSLWRLGTDPTTVDSFTNTAGTSIGSHVGELGADWTNYSYLFNSGSAGALTNEGRIRRNGTRYSHYYASGTPASADYCTEADLHVKSLYNGDVVGVVVRHTSGAWYRGGYTVGNTATATGWKIAKGAADASETDLVTALGSAEALSVGQTYRIRLEAVGSALKLYVNGALKLSTTDTSFTSVGKPGVRLGSTTSVTTPTDTTGMHLDNVRSFACSGAAGDSKGTNNGTYQNGALMNVPGALAGDYNGAVLLDGTNDHVSIADAATLDLGDGPLSVEAWVKRSNTNTTMQTIFGRGTNAFQVGLNSNRLRLLKEGGASVVDGLSTITDTTGFHHYVVTKSGSSTKLYVDGVDQTGTVSNQTLTSTATALYLGARGGTADFLAGTLDEAAIYNVALPAATVLDHYRVGTGTG